MEMPRMLADNIDFVVRLWRESHRARVPYHMECEQFTVTYNHRTSTLAATCLYPATASTVATQSPTDHGSSRGEAGCIGSGSDELGERNQASVQTLATVGASR